MAEAIPIATSINSLMLRSRTPGETLKRVVPFLPIFGITRIADVTGLDRVGIPVALATRPNSRSVSVSQGKGLTLDQAKVSAVMESIETWHAENISQQIRYASYEDLRYKHRIVDVHRIPLSAYKNFNPMERLAWIETKDLATGQNWLVPFELINADYSEPRFPGCGSFHATTNGLASGNNYDEALYQAMLEVVERDAVSLWSVAGDEGLRLKAIKLNTIIDKEICDLISKIHQAGLEIAIWDITSDTNIPTFACLIHQSSKGKDSLEIPEIGTGAHLSPKVALIRAVTEAAQVRLTFISGSRDDIHAKEYSKKEMKSRIEWGRHLAHMVDGGVGDFTKALDLSKDSVSENIETVRLHLKNIGCNNVLISDLSKKEFDIAVVRVLIPGLEGPLDGQEMDCLPGPRAQKIFLALNKGLFK